MVDHASVSKVNIQKLKDAYANQPSIGKVKSPSRPIATASSSHPRAYQPISTVGVRMLDLLFSDGFDTGISLAWWH